MKKVFLTMIALTAISIMSVSAQAVWGARVGLSRPTASTSEGFKVDGKFGLEVGPTLYYSLKNNFYINSGLMLSMKSFEFGTETLSMYYADIPLYVGYQIPVGGLSTYAQAGPFVGFKLAEDVPGNEGEKSGLTSFNAGLGLMYGINVDRFKVELGYQYGLINVLDDTDGGGDLKLGSFFVGVSYVF